jgi:hypothetical protein
MKNLAAEGSRGYLGDYGAAANQGFGLIVRWENATTFYPGAYGFPSTAAVDQRTLTIPSWRIPDTYHQFVFVYTGRNNLSKVQPQWKLYIDGNEVGVANVNDFGFNNTNLMIGRTYANQTMKGFIKYARLYSRPLNPWEVSQNYEEHFKRRLLSIDVIFRVLDENMVPVTGADIKIGDQTGVTNQEGECRILDVPVGNHDIRMVKKGYKTVFMNENVSATKTLNIETEAWDTHDVTFEITGDDPEEQ